jgi:hypothetical protein
LIRLQKYILLRQIFFVLVCMKQYRLHKVPQGYVFISPLIKTNAATVFTLYGIFHNSLTHCKELVHVNGAMDGNMRHTDRRRNSPSLFCILPPLRGYVETPPSHDPPSPLKGLVGLRVLRYTGTRHIGIFHTIALCCFSPAGPFRTWFENVAAPSRSIVFGHTQARIAIFA